MDIYSDNLGPEFAARVRRRRASETEAFEAVPSPTNALAVLLAVCLSLTLLFALVGAAPLAWMMGLIAATLLLLRLGGRLIRRAGTRREQVRHFGGLTPYELHDLASPQNSPLMRGYLELAADVLRADIPDPDAQREVRAALQALGTTAHALPADEPPSLGDNPGTLRADADRLACEADAETDAVIAASLRRRAESLSRRADTAARTLLLLRRNQALARRRRSRSRP